MVNVDCASNCAQGLPRRSTVATHGDASAVPARATNQGLHPAPHGLDAWAKVRAHLLLDHPKPTRDNQLWVSNITYLPLANSNWVYLCTFQDIASGLIDSRGAGDQCFMMTLLFLATHAWFARALRPRRSSVLRQRLPATAARLPGPTLAEPPQ